MRAEGAFLFSKKLRAELLPNFEDHERSRILAAWGESGHELGELNWAHGLACPSEDHLHRRYEQLARAEAGYKREEVNSE
jgi:hypothetical protein